MQGQHKRPALGCLFRRPHFFYRVKHSTAPTEHVIGKANEQNIGAGCRRSAPQSLRHQPFRRFRIYGAKRDKRRSRGTANPRPAMDDQRSLPIPDADIAKQRLDVRPAWMHQALLRRHDVVHGNAQMIGSVDAGRRFQHCLLVDERNQMACARFGEDIRHETERANMQPDRARTGRNFPSTHLLNLKPHRNVAQCAAPIRCFS